MEYLKLGASGLEISQMILGCMSFGEPARGPQPWSLPEEQSRPIIQAALEAGITTFDTADVYSAGSSEEITGRALRDMAKREEIQLFTKVFNGMFDGPNGAGLSRKHIMEGIDASLRRLGTDYVDLYQIHRWDAATPIEETMEALHDVVKAGKALYIGASSMWTWQFAKAQYTADLGGWTRFVAMQDHYSLLCREEEREMLPFCLDQGVGVIPWSPLARGKLARPWGVDGTARAGTDVFGQALYRQQLEADRKVVEAVAAIAAARGVSQAQVALAWARQQEAVSAPIVGCTKLSHLSDAVASCDITLSADELAELESPYLPRLPEGF